MEVSHAGFSSVFAGNSTSCAALQKILRLKLRRSYPYLRRFSPYLRRFPPTYGVVPLPCLGSLKVAARLVTTCHKRSFQPLHDQNVNNSCHDVNRDLRQGLQHLEKCYHEAWKRWALLTSEKGEGNFRVWTDQNNILFGRSNKTAILLLWRRFHFSDGVFTFQGLSYGRKNELRQKLLPQQPTAKIIASGGSIGMILEGGGPTLRAWKFDLVSYGA